MNIKEKIKPLFAKKNPSRDAAFAPRTVFQPPEQGMSRAIEIVGTFLRGVTVFCGLFGSIHLLYESVGLYSAEQTDTRFQYLSVPFMLFICLIFSALTAIAPFNRITKICVPIGAVGALFGLAALKGSPLVLFENAARRLYNGVVEGMFYAGYTSFAAYFASEEYSFDPGRTLVRWSVVLVAAVFSVLFYFSVTRRTGWIVYSLTIAIITVPVCLFNIALGTLGFSFIIASIAGFTAMRIVDTRYGGRLGKRLERREAKAERKASRGEEKNKRKIERLKMKQAANAIYDAAIDAELGVRRARQAKRSVRSRVMRDERRLNRKRRLDKIELKRRERKAKIDAHKAKRLALKDASRARKEAIASEAKMPADVRRAVKAKRLEHEAQLRREAKCEKRLAAKKKREASSEIMKKKRRNRAASGFAGLAACAIALVAGLIPFAISKKPFPTIRFIDDRVEHIRSVVTDALLGDSVDLTENPYSDYELFGFEKLTFDERRPPDVQIFVVEAPTNMPVFLKSRTALDFDLGTDTWSFASNDTVLEMNRKFGKGFTPDVITHNAYSYLYPYSDATPSERDILRYNLFGFIVEQVHVFRQNGASGILFVPSVMNSRIGLCEYSSFNKAKDKYSAFYDGIYTSRHYGVGTNGYSTVSYVYDPFRSDISDVLESERKTLDLTYDLAIRERNGENADELLKEYVAAAEDLYKYNNIGERYFNAMSDKEKNDFVDAIELEHKYREYANETYAAPSGDDEISVLASTIVKDAEEKKGAPLTRYEMVIAVIDHLRSTSFFYSKSPAIPHDITDSVLKGFLFETKTGYCSHFASAATVLLREAGVPVRFTEGYRVPWEISTANGGCERYRWSVDAENAHTWIEVYFDEIGWIPFEVTQTMNVGMYTAAKEEIPSDTPTYEDEGELVIPETTTRPKPAAEKEKSEENTELPREEGIDLWSQFKGFLIALGVIALVLFLIRLLIGFIKKRADREISRRYVSIGYAKDERHYDDFRTDNRKEAKYLIDTLFEIFKATDIGPGKGEQLSEFGARLSADYPGLSTVDAEQVMTLILKEEYGHGLTHDEMASLASYLEDVIKTVYAGLTFKERIKLRYIKRII